DAVGLPARGEQAAVVGVARRQVADHGVDDSLRDLRAAGAVEEGGGAAAARALEGRELAAERRHVEHADSSRERGRGRRVAWNGSHFMGKVRDAEKGRVKNWLRAEGAPDGRGRPGPPAGGPPRA